MGDEEQLDRQGELTPEELAQLEEERLAAERSYFNVTRSLSAGVLFALPLLAAYELGVLIFGRELNAAADILKTPFSWLQEHPTQIFGVDLMLVAGLVLIALALAAVWRVGRLGALRAGTFAGMFCESLLYAMLLGPLALAPITGELKFGGFSPHLEDFLLKLTVAAGAGFYEEAFFRFAVLGAIFYLAKELGKLRPFAAGALALVLSGAFFSAAHFLGGEEAPALGMFIYRLAAGTILGLVFLTRGFGIAAWTHAIYDLYVLCFAAG
jgi:hypothetical protein